MSCVTTTEVSLQTTERDAQVAEVDGTITDIVVNVTATHTFAGDLHISITSAEDTFVMLSSKNGLGNDNYTNTTFDDDAATPISDADAPFTGTFAPDEALSQMLGETVEGTWHFAISDTNAIDDGTMDAFRAAICVTPTE